jgi:hypothetical protein
MVKADSVGGTQPTSARYSSPTPIAMVRRVKANRFCWPRCELAGPVIAVGARKLPPTMGPTASPTR